MPEDREVVGILLLWARQKLLALKHGLRDWLPDGVLVGVGKGSRLQADLSSGVLNERGSGALVGRSEFPSISL